MGISQDSEDFGDVEGLRRSQDFEDFMTFEDFEDSEDFEDFRMLSVRILRIPEGFKNHQAFKDVDDL